MPPDLTKGKNSLLGLLALEIAILVVAFMFGDSAAHLIQYRDTAFNQATLLENPLNQHPTDLVSYVLINLLMIFSLGLYNPRMRESIRNVLRRLMMAMTLGFVCLILIAQFLPSLAADVIVLALANFAAIILLGLTRASLPYLDVLKSFRFRVVVIGAGERAAIIEKRMRRKVDRRHFELIGYLPMPGDREGEIKPELLLESGENLQDLVDRYAADELVIACDERRNQLPVDQLLACKLNGVRITDILSFIERETGQFAVNLAYPSWMIYSDGFAPPDNVRSHLDTLFNVTLAITLSLVLWPFMLLTALAIWLEDGRKGGSILYKQVRVGLAGKPFYIYKFRSMRSDAEKHGAQWAKENDNRITKVGSFIRKYRLDELPQLYNVLRGDMGFVGPRPERPEFVERLTAELPFYAERHAVKPGLTGWAQLCYPYGASTEDALEKLKYDLYYVKHRSFLLDMLIFVQTAEVVLFKKGAR